MKKTKKAWLKVCNFKSDENYGNKTLKIFLIDS